MAMLFGGTEAISSRTVKIETQGVANATAVVHLVVLPRCLRTAAVVHLVVLPRCFRSLPKLPLRRRRNQAVYRADG